MRLPKIEPPTMTATGMYPIEAQALTHGCRSRRVKHTARKLRQRWVQRHLINHQGAKPWCLAGIRACSALKINVAKFILCAYRKFSTGAIGSQEL